MHRLEDSAAADGVAGTARAWGLPSWMSYLRVRRAGLANIARHRDKAAPPMWSSWRLFFEWQAAVPTPGPPARRKVDPRLPGASRLGLPRGQPRCLVRLFCAEAHRRPSVFQRARPDCQPR